MKHRRQKKQSDFGKKLTSDCVSLTTLVAQKDKKIKIEDGMREVVICNRWGKMIVEAFSILLSVIYLPLGGVIGLRPGANVDF